MINSHSQVDYLQMLQAFVSTGEEPDLTLCPTDALAQCLGRFMQHAPTKVLVRSNAVAARIFIDTLSQFVSRAQQKATFQAQRVSSERKQREEASIWSHTKRSENWAALLQKLNEKYLIQGFNTPFYQHELSQPEASNDDALWQALMTDWEQQIDLRLKSYKQQFIDTQAPLLSQQLQGNLKHTTQYVCEHHIPLERFFQIWALMGGQWNSLEFERLMHTVNFQQRYPVLLKITNQMGRRAEAQGTQRIGYTSGTSEQMEHASQSDITGITLGRELTALLPSEWAHFLDEDLENVFFQKYVTSRLQTFSYQSHALNSARSLHTKPARPKGPMVVCVDRSGSMMGQPSEVTLSLMMRLCELCYEQQRSCHLIAFTTQAQPIDVLTDRTQLLRFFHGNAEGGTDAHQLLNKLYQLLRTNTNYAGADVLWVSDFRIPLPELSLFKEWKRLQHEGTRFYALQLGIAQNHWHPLFNANYQIADIAMAVR